MAITNHSFSRTNNICCKQVVPATTFKCNVSLKTYQIFPSAKLQEQRLRTFIRMFEMSVTICWEIRNRIQNRDSTTTEKMSPERKVHQHQIIAALKDTILILPKRLKIGENFWNLKLEILHPKGLNRELTKI